MLNKTEVISSPQVGFSYPASFLFSQSITSKCPAFTFIPWLLVPCKKGNSFSNTAT